MADPTSLEGNVFPPVTGPNALSAPKSATAKSGTVLNEIEAEADYYVPSIYQVLNFYSNYQAEPDTNESFIPVAQTKPNPKLFVVGVMPPNVNLSGRLLDRSASVSNIVGDPVTLDEPEGRSTPQKVVDDIVVSFQDGTKGAALPDTFWQNYVSMCNRLQVDPYELGAVLDKESGFNPAAQNFGPPDRQPRTTPVAQGLCQFVRATATTKRVGMDEDTWATYSLLSAEEQLPYVERFYQGKAAGKTKDDLNLITFGAYNNPDGSIYASKEAQADWIASHPEDAGKFKNPEKQDRALKQNKRASKDGGRTIRKEGIAQNLAPYPRDSIKARIASAVDYHNRNPQLSPATVPPAENSTNGEWVGSGSANASAAKKEISKTSDKNLNRQSLGNRFLLAQAAEIKQTAQAIEALRNAPPLRLLVNPSSLRISSEKVISDGNWTRNGPIIEQWGDNQDKIEASGKVAAFFAIDANPTSPDAQGEGPGLTRGARQYSAGYQNFMSLYLLYRNNANVLTSGLDLPDSRGSFFSRLSMVGSMYIFYDDTMYLGSFDSFNITETDTAPYTLEYSFQFTVRATFLLDRPAEYGPQATAFIKRPQVVPTTTQQQGDPDFSTVPLPPGVTG